MPIHASAVVAPTARVHPDASIGAGARIGEYCVIESDVAIGAECVLEPYVFVKRWTTMGERNEISVGTALGVVPSDKSFTGARSYVRIGDGNRIREHVTVSRGTTPESATEIGHGNYIMSSAHVAHNCKIGDDIVLAACSLLAGYVEVEDQAFISGIVAVHQFSKIGRLAMIAGNTGVSTDVPPFITCAGYRGDATGLNLVGMKRAGFDAARIAAVKRAYAILYRSGLLLEEALARMEAEIEEPEARHIAGFIRRSKRGICRERARR
jgi:UDP-N-acetylglucosamine acyltransferase